MYRDSFLCGVFFIIIFLFLFGNSFIIQAYAASIAGDVNGDGIVDTLDFNGIVNCFGIKITAPSCTTRSGADINLDGVVDGIDYNLFLRAFIVQLSATPIPSISTTLTPTASSSGTPVPTITNAMQGG